MSRSLNKVSEPNLRNKYDFQSDVLDIIIGGQSTIDSTTAFQVLNLEEADLFIKGYGYDLDNPIEKAEVLGNFHEALNFIRKNFLQPENPDGLKLEIPRKILELTDVRELFLMIGPSQVTSLPADYSKLTLQNWACSILKVMHTIAHIDKDLRSSYFADIQKQIFDRFYKAVHRDAEGKLFLGDKDDDPFRVDLVAFETKPKKSRDSIILKLLHKSENVAEDIFDRVGIRFVTHSPLGALQVIKYLKDKMIVMAPNIKPSRSRNTLVYIEGFRSQLDKLLSAVEATETSEEENNKSHDATHTATLAQNFARDVEQITQPTSANLDNPHSSEHYRAIQFTCRQLIKLRNPLYNDLRELKALVKAKPLDDDVLKTIDRIDLKYTQREIRFFYPFEVQVVDIKSAEENEKGKSSHSEYKRSQIFTAMKRVMGVLTDDVR